MALPFPQIDPIAFQIGPLPVRWYGLSYLAGFLLGWLYARYLAARERKADGTPLYFTKENIDDFLPWAVGGVILGGRLGYILFYQFGGYIENPMAALRIWEGGMSFHGGALGVIAAMIIYARRHKLPLLRLTDIVCAVAPIGLFFGRIANFINGELFGKVTDVPWAVEFPHGGMLPRHPSQLYEAGLEGIVLGALLAVLIHKAGVRNRPGIVSGVFLAGYGAARFFVEFFRIPDPQIGYLAGEWLTMGMVLTLPMILFGAGLIIYAVRNTQTKD